MTFDTDKLRKYSVELISEEVDDERKYKILRFIKEQKLSIEQLQKSRIGKSVKKCTKIEGHIGGVAKEIIQKWGVMIEQFCENKKKLSIENGSNVDNQTNERVHKKHKRVKSEALTNPHSDKKSKATQLVKESENDIKSFHDIINDGAMSLKAEELTRKRRSDVFAFEGDQKRQRSAEPSFIPNTLPDLPQLNADSEDESNIFYGSDSFALNNTRNVSHISTEEIDVTSKYSSERKVWVPKSKNGQQDTAESPEECEYINGVPLSEIVSYNSKQLTEFEGDSRTVKKQTDQFWQKLFTKTYKCASRFDGENWRDAYFRIESEEAAKLKMLSERLNKKTENSKKNESKAVMINAPLKANRRFGSFRR